jgi:hypothetical protein
MHGGRKGGANLLLTELVALISRAAMPRRARTAPGELAYHTPESNERTQRLFSKPEDYTALTEPFSMLGFSIRTGV